MPVINSIININFLKKIDKENIALELSARPSLMQFRALQRRLDHASQQSVLKKVYFGFFSGVRDN